MSHRKFEHPRSGHLGFLPKRRTKYTLGKIRHFPKDDAAKPIHLTAFMGYKAGMTHVVRTYDKKEGKKTVKKDMVDAVTVIETPPMKIVGMVGYIDTPRGLRALTTVWAQNLPTNVLRRFYKNYYNAKKRAFTNYSKKYDEKADSKKHVNRDIQRIKKYCQVVRVLCATQIEKVKLRQRKAHLMEIQVNGGKNIVEKADWAVSKFENEVTVGEVFADNEMVDTISITIGKGTAGVIKRFGVTKLPRKTRRGNRKVACIGAWHPSAVKWTVARSGILGYYHRTQINQKIYRIGAGAIRGINNNASTETDAHIKNITPLGGFPHYGVVNEDFVMVRGSVMGPKKRQVTIRKAMHPSTNSFAAHQLDIKFIDTASKIGHGKFQTLEEKDKFLGPLASKQRAE
jgi:large subunit ribosomal protein L3e